MHAFAGFIDLGGPLAVAAYLAAESGGVYGTPVLGAALTAVVAKSAREAAAVAAALALALGVGAYVNEYHVKPALAVSRPNVLALAGAGRLPVSAGAFHALPKDDRTAAMEEALTPDAGLHPWVRAHWVAETGYSFPSGHSFSAAAFAAFFLVYGSPKGKGWRRAVAFAVPAWAAAVCLSRVVLEVHSPADVAAGAAEGAVMGASAAWVVRKIVG